MITNEQFDLAAREVRSNPMALLPVMIDYKNFIQRAIIGIFRKYPTNCLPES